MTQKPAQEWTLRDVDAALKNGEEIPPDVLHMTRELVQAYKEDPVAMKLRLWRGGIPPRAVREIEPEEDHG